MPIIFAVIAILSLLSWPALAEMPCTTQGEKFLQNLENNYGEVLVGRGITAGGWLMEHFLSPDSSWSLIVIMPDGRLCFLASGQGWQNIDPTPREMEAER